MNSSTLLNPSVAMVKPDREAILSMLQEFLSERFGIPVQTASLDRRLAELGLDPECTLLHVAGTSQINHTVEHALSPSAGFGGTNVVLAVSKEHDLSTKTLGVGESIS